MVTAASPLAYRTASPYLPQSARQIYKHWFMFDIKFLIFFDLVPLRHICHEKNIGFQQAMCQFVSKFVLETKFVPLFPTASIVDKRQNFQYGHRKNNKNAITLQDSSYHKTHHVQYCVVTKNVIYLGT